jgi:hypothetical protein
VGWELAKKLLNLGPVLITPGLVWGGPIQQSGSFFLMIKTLPVEMMSGSV